jgi:mono/diheme cytochrome c family protein
MRHAIAVSLAILTMMTAALAQSPALGPGRGDPARGRVIAGAWCSSCHVVAPDQARGVSDVPTFSSIAQRLPTDLDVLAAFVANPHPPMPNLDLSRQDIRDVLSYIATQK